MTRRFLLVGLTGGIATGKSTAADVFRRLGCVVIDADVLAREVVLPGEPAHARIVAEFGREVLLPDGALDRKKLGAIVFADPARRRRLEAITHPAIRARLAARLEALAGEGFDGVVVFDAPVMVESGNYKTMDRLVVVVAADATQRARLAARDGLDAEEVGRRIASQMPLAEKAKLADYVIDNSGDPAATEAQARRVHAALVSERRIAVSLAGCPTRLAGLFPVGMGMFGQNRISVVKVFKQLSASPKARFLGYHWRPSGNFVFEDTGDAAMRAVLEIGQRKTGLRCIVRRFPELVWLDWAVPARARTTGGSVVVDDDGMRRRVIAVLLSADAPVEARRTGLIRPRIEVLSWVSGRDVVCVYNRPQSGSVGLVTEAVLATMRSLGSPPDLAGTGRAMGVIRDILGGKVERAPTPRARRNEGRRRR